jgi:hypothetical protein
MCPNIYFGVLFCGCRILGHRQTRSRPSCHYHCPMAGKGTTESPTCALPTRVGYHLLISGNTHYCHHLCWTTAPTRQCAAPVSELFVDRESDEFWGIRGAAGAPRPRNEWRSLLSVHQPRYHPLPPPSHPLPTRRPSFVSVCRARSPPVRRGRQSCCGCWQMRTGGGLRRTG